MYRSFAIAVSCALSLTSFSQPTFAADVASSPWGPDDEIGRLNLITPESRRSALANLNPATTYDLSVEYFIGMPSWQAAGDPHFQLWMTHTPRGTIVDDPLSVGDSQNARVSYSGSAFSMYSHTGTHIDALNHFGLNGKIWNHFSAEHHLGDRGRHARSAVSAASLPRSQVVRVWTTLETRLRARHAATVVGSSSCIANKASLPLTSTAPLVPTPEFAVDTAVVEKGASKPSAT